MINKEKGNLMNRCYISAQANQAQFFPFDLFTDKIILFEEE